MFATMQERRDHIKSLLGQAGARFVRVHFTKADGTPRDLVTCNTAAVDLVTERGDPAALQAMAEREQSHPHLIRRYDVHARGWRTINLDTVTELCFDGARHPVEAVDPTAVEV